MGEVERVRAWWDQLVRDGPGFGYFPNAKKTWLVTKSQHHQKACEVFEGTGVNVTSSGRPYLGAPIGTRAYVELFMKSKVLQWAGELNTLASFARSQPHAAHSAFTRGLTSEWVYLARTTPEVGPLLQPLEDIVRRDFLPALTERSPPGDDERLLLGHPARLGGIAVSNPAANTNAAFDTSTTITRSLTSAILSQSMDYSYEVMSDQMSAKSKVHQFRRQQSAQQAATLREKLPDSLKRALDLASEKGASNWLSTLPIEEFGFTLHKGAFHDAIALRYGWHPSRTPSHCSCGSSFTVEHALSCARGGFPILRHNELRDLTASLLTEVCHEVCVEPTLQPITGETFQGVSANTEDRSRLDVAVSGFWGGHHERTFCDVRVFNPHAPSNRCSNLASAYRKHEKLKKNSYEQKNFLSMPPSLLWCFLLLVGWGRRLTRSTRGWHPFSQLSGMRAIVTCLLG